jgi:TolB-like protein
MDWQRKIKMTLRISLNLLLLAALILSGCGRKSRWQYGNDYVAAIGQLSQAELLHPNDWKIKRDLGIAYFLNQQTKQGVGKLSQAHELKPSDGRTLLYLGLGYERANMPAKATEIFERHLSNGVSGRLGEELRARIRENRLKALRLEMTKRVADFKQNSHLPITPASVAVLYFRNISRWPELDPLLKGITAFITSDLEKMGHLQVVDRLKTQFLLEELSLSTDQLFDQMQTRSLGRLLGVNYLVIGGIERPDDANIELNAGIVETKNGRLKGEGIKITGTVSEITNLSKQVALALVRDLGLPLTDAEVQTLRQFQTRSSIAFIAFSKGLDFEDRQLFAQARYQYNKALKQDGSFALAKTRLSELPGSRLPLSEMDKLAFNGNAAKQRKAYAFISAAYVTQPKAY